VSDGTRQRGPRRVTGLIVAAGSSRRLGHPKQLLPFRGATLLDAVVDTARACGFGQLVVTLGAAGDEVRDQVDLRGTTIVDSPHHTEGCASSIRAAVDVVDPDSDGIVLLLGDQPGVLPGDVAALVAATRDAALGVCRYRDGLGHPLWLGREIFDDLRELRGDKAVWKLLDDPRHEVVEVPGTGAIPLDVDTWEDHLRLLDAEVARGR
jgi:molybdenum cofactor cytidylyltransferase